MEKKATEILLKRKLTIAVAESCTGGLVADSLTNIPGSSSYFICGIVAYANSAKIKLLHVKPQTLKKHGAVSQETAIELARNIKRLAKTSIGLSTTGIAGPGGGTEAKPVGTVFMAIAIGRHAYFKKYLFSGNRLDIKHQAKNASLQLLYECLTQPS
jgi:nicotinamide-nucleotide amidase